jgi:hypothetical protein
MRTYYERHLVCRKCKDRMRQTVYNLPLNKTGRMMEQAQERDYRNSHSCNSDVAYTDWRLISDRDYTNKTQPRTNHKVG